MRLLDPRWIPELYSIILHAFSLYDLDVWEVSRQTISHPSSRESVEEFALFRPWSDKNSSQGVSCARVLVLSTVCSLALQRVRGKNRFEAHCKESDLMEPGALIPSKKRGRGTGLSISVDTRALIARQINEEKKAASAVARELGLALPSVRQIAGAARGDARFVGSKQKRSDAVMGGMPVVSMPPSPFPGDQPPNLRGRRLTVEEKHYLACLINIQRVPHTHVAEQCGVHEKTLFRLAHRALAGKPLDPVQVSFKFGFHYFCKADNFVDRFPVWFGTSLFSFFFFWLW